MGHSALEDIPGQVIKGVLLGPGPHTNGEDRQAQQLEIQYLTLALLFLLLCPFVDKKSLPVIGPNCLFQQFLSI